MIKVILYHPGQYAILKDETYKVCESTYGLFEILSYGEDFPLGMKHLYLSLKEEMFAF